MNTPPNTPVSAQPAMTKQLSMTAITELKARRDALNQELMSLHLQISAAEHDAAPEHKCRFNGVEVFGKSPCRGVDLRQRLMPDQSAHLLYLENTGNAPDLMIRDSDPIPNGARVYSYPNGIMGG